LSLEVALVLAHPEETVETPTGSPGVGNNPVRVGASNAPTDDLDGVTTELVTGGVVVDTGVVGHEVGVDGETGLDWTVGVDFLLDGVDVSEGAVSLGLVLLPSAGSRARGSAGWDLAVAGDVRVAGVRDDTGAGEVVPGLVEVTTLAAVVGPVAGDHVLWGEDDVVATFDAGSVGEDLRGRESPAGAASGLVSDGVDARWPLVLGVERGWEGDEILQDLGLLRWHWGEWLDDSTKKESLDLGLGHARELVGGGDPTVLNRVDVINLLLGTNVGTVGEGDQGQAE